MEITKRQLQDEEVTAYHGGPHSFDKFSTQHMGTGEGANTFGWGLYFTDLEDIARDYANKLSDVMIQNLSIGNFTIIKDNRYIGYDIAKTETETRIVEHFAVHDQDIKNDYKKGLDLNKVVLLLLQEFIDEEKQELKYASSKFSTKDNDVIYYKNSIREAESLKRKPIKINITSNRNLYKVSLHKGKTPEQYTWLEWYKPVPEKVMNTLGKKLIHNGNFLKDLFDNSREYEKTDGTKVKGLYPDGLMFYKRISQILGGDKEASLFLLENGIDGIKYPADSLSRGATSYNTSGFNYVVFDENAVNIEKQTQLEGMEISKKELRNQKVINQAHKDITRTKGKDYAPNKDEIQKWIDNNPQKVKEITKGELKEDAEDVNFMGEITKGELEEAKKKKADRCLRIARKKIPKSSAYRSGNIVRCRQGEIWKDLKEEEETDFSKVVKPILNKDINIKSSEGRKGLVPISELEEFIGEDRLGKAQMSTSRVTIDKLKKDISKNGFKEPIIIFYDKFSGNGEAIIIEGNHRIIAAKELGLTEVPVIFEKGTIRDNESRINNKMFPIKRKTIGKIDDTFGVRGSDLGLTVRQPTEADFVKSTEQSQADSVNEDETLDEKTDFSKEKKQGLHGWFARQGGKGKSKGWVDCNTCRDGKCKSCGRKEGESRSKYPACRPTPSACKTKGKGKSWGKRSTNEDALIEQSKQDIERELKLNEIKNTFKRLLK
jgi:hypothetical protein